MEVVAKNTLVNIVIPVKIIPLSSKVWIITEGIADSKIMDKTGNTT